MMWAEKGGRNGRRANCVSPQNSALQKIIRKAYIQHTHLILQVSLFQLLFPPLPPSERGRAANISETSKNKKRRRIKLVKKKKDFPSRQGKARQRTRFLISLFFPLSPSPPLTSLLFPFPSHIPFHISFRHISFHNPFRPFFVCGRISFQPLTSRQQ